VTTASNLGKLINTAHYCPLRIALKDYQYKFSKHQLLRMCKRASLTEWVQYNLASIAIKTVNNKEPYHLNQFLHESLYVTRRKPSMGNFYDNSEGKVGKEKINCKLKCMEQIKFDWLGIGLTSTTIGSASCSGTYFLHTGTLMTKQPANTMTTMTIIFYWILKVLIIFLLYICHCGHIWFFKS